MVHTGGDARPNQSSQSLLPWTHNLKKEPVSLKNVVDGAVKINFTVSNLEYASSRKILCCIHSVMVDMTKSTGAIVGVSKWTGHSFYGMPFFLEKKERPNYSYLDLDICKIFSQK